MSNLNDYRAHMAAARAADAEAQELGTRLCELTAEREAAVQELTQQEQTLARSGTAYLDGSAALNMDAATAAIAALRVKVNKLNDLIGAAQTRIHDAQRRVDRQTTYAHNIIGLAQIEQVESVIADRLAGAAPDLELIAAMERIPTATLLRLLDDAGARAEYEAARTRVLTLS